MNQSNRPGNATGLASRVVVATIAGGLVFAVFAEAIAAKRGGGTVITALGSFVDQLAGYDTSRWMKADRWTNGSPFDNAWRADHVIHDTTSGGVMSLKLSNRAYLGEPYSSGEYRTKGFYGYGCYEVRMRPVARAGVVSSFFTFAGPYDNGGNGKHNEIDIEFLGKDMSRVQFNFWTNDDAYAQDNSYLHQLGFQADAALHNYGFRWTSGGIEWYVDGGLVYQFTEGPNTARTPKETDSFQKIMMNVWPVDATAAAWAGTFTYPGSPLNASYEWVRYDSDEANCSFTYATNPL